MKPMPTAKEGYVEAEAKVGRPPGPVDPIKQHERELVGWVKVGARIRKLVETELDFFENKLKNAHTGNTALSIDDMLSIMQALGNLLTVSTKTVETGFKALERPGSGPTKDETDPNRIAELLEGGRGS